MTLDSTSQELGLAEVTSLNTPETSSYRYTLDSVITCPLRKNDRESLRVPLRHLVPFLTGYHVLAAGYGNGRSCHELRQTTSLRCRYARLCLESLSHGGLTCLLHLSCQEQTTVLCKRQELVCRELCWRLLMLACSTLFYHMVMFKICSSLRILACSLPAHSGLCEAALWPPILRLRAQLPRRYGHQ